MCHLALISDDGGFVYQSEFSLIDTYHQFLLDVSAQLSKAKQCARFDGYIGICLPGHLDPQTGLVSTPSLSIINKKPLKSDLQAALNHGIKIANFGHCLAKTASLEAEYQDYQMIFALVMDANNVFGGLIAGGQLINGAHGLCGNWGHISLPWPVDYELDGRICECGRTGCLAHFTSLSGLSYDYQMLTGTSVTADQIISQAHHGDIIAESAMQVAEDRLARGLAMVINLLDPELIILSGLLAKESRIYVNIPRKWPGYVQMKPIKTRLAHLNLDIPPHHHLLKGAAFLAA